MYDQANESEIMSWDIPGEMEFYYSPMFGTNLAMPEWEAIITLVFLSAVILTTIIGNILVKFFNQAHCCPLFNFVNFLGRD